MPHSRQNECSGGAGPGGEGEARRGAVLEGDEAAGNRVGDVERAQVGTAEAAVRAEARAFDRPEVGDRAVGLDDADAVLDRGRDVEASVGVEAEAVAAALAELLDDPFAAASGAHTLETEPLDDHDRAVGLERDAVAVEEASRELAHAAVAAVDHHPADEGLGRWVGAGI